MPPRKRLTAKQESLARAAAKSTSISQAARSIGIHPNSAYRMLEKDGVQGRIDALRERDDERRTDKALAIVQRSQRVVLEALPEDGSADPNFALAAYRVGADVLEKLPRDNEAAAIVESPSQRGRRLRSHLHAAYVGACHPEWRDRLRSALGLDNGSAGMKAPVDPPASAGFLIEGHPEEFLPSDGLNPGHRSEI